MLYRKSRARDQFERDLAGELAILKQAGASKIKSPDIRNYVYSSIISRCSSHVEIYIEQVIGDWATQLSSQPTPNQHLDARLRAFLITHKHIDDHSPKYIVGKDEGVYLDAIAGTITQPEWQLLIGSANIPANIDFGAIVRNKRFPSPKNVKRVLRRIGISDPFSLLNPIIKGQFEQLLQSYNDVRNNFAHNGVFVGSNSADIRKKLADLTRIVGAIDRLLYRYIKAQFGARYWT